MDTNKHELSEMKWRTALIYCLVALTIFLIGCLVLDWMDYQQTTKLLAFVKNQPPQLQESSNRIRMESLQDIQGLNSSRITMDAIGIFIALFGLWCVPHALRENTAPAVKDK